MNATSILAGPVVRSVLPEGATVWIALDHPGEVTLTVHDGARRVAEGRRAAVRVLAGVHVVAVAAVPGAGPLEWGKAYTYTLTVDGVAIDLGPFCLPGQDRPGFRLFAAEHAAVRFLHGSCRKPGGRGPDALAAAVELLKGRHPPQALFLTGDQIYADDVAEEVFEALDPVTPGERASYIRGAGFTTTESRFHLVDFREFVRMYLYAWTTSPEVRIVLANVATWMMFDDHDVTDDWNLDEAWAKNLQPEGRAIVNNALAAYALFQHWGNVPGCFDHPAGARFLANPADPSPLLDDPTWRWSWRFETNVFTALGLDTRTRRAYAAPHARPGLLREEDMPGPDARHLGGFTLVVSPAPVLGQGLVERLQQMSAGGKRPDNYKNDQEPWSGDDRAYTSFLDHLAGLGHVLVLSGDVHFGYAARLAEPKGGAWEIVNLTSSALLNETAAAQSLPSLSAWDGARLQNTALEATVTVRGGAVKETLAEDDGAVVEPLQAGHRTTRVIARNHVGEVWFQPGIVVQRYVIPGEAACPEHTVRFQPAGAAVSTLQSGLSLLGRSGSAPVARQRAQDLLATEGQMTGAPVKALEGALERLKALNCFAEMVTFVEAAGGAPSSKVQLLYAQALIDTHRCTRAIEVLRAIEPAGCAHIATERTGLLGRAYKQLWVDAAPNSAEPREADLVAARDAYAGIALNDAKDPEWLLVNQLAIETAVANRLPTRAAASRSHARALAEQLWARPVDEENPWAQANRLEAALVLGKDLRTLSRLLWRYLSHRDVTAFNARGTLRQLIQLHGLTRETEPGSLLLPTLEGAVLQKGGTGDFLDFGPARLKEVPAQGGSLPLKFLRDGLKRARSVGRVEAGGLPVGTGFVADLSAARPEWNRVFVTNAHVVDVACAAQRHALARLPEEVVVRFWGEDGGSRTTRLRWLWSSPVAQCDVAVLELLEPRELPVIEVGPHGTVGSAGRSFMNVIGHPAGQDARISVQDNELVDWNDEYLWYRAGTEPGSSGSPVFDNQWHLVGLHHARNDGRALNEGIPLHRILKELSHAC